MERRDILLGHVAARPRWPAGFRRRVRPTNCNPVNRFVKKRILWGQNRRTICLDWVLVNRSVKANNATLEMEVDTGAAASVISKKTYKHLWRHTTRPALKPCDMLLRTYTGERLNICGMISLNVEYKHRRASLDVLVVVGDGPSLMGRD